MYTGLRTYLLYYTSKIINHELPLKSKRSWRSTIIDTGFIYFMCNNFPVEY